MRNQAGSGLELNAGVRGPARSVVLVGFMGAGKTSVGKALAQRLGWHFEDLDDRIQAHQGRSIAQIFQDSGEAAFRRAEHDALRELLAELKDHPQVIAVGGGAFAQAENVALLAGSPVTTVFLDGPAEELFRRCQREQTERPLRRDLEQFRQLYESRRPRYLEAELCIKTGGKDIETAAAEVARALGLLK